MPKVTEAHLEARRQQILDAAWTCFARKGYHQTTMQDICEESELSPGAIYRYFASKEAIRTAVYDRQQKWARDVLEKARSQAGRPRDILAAIGRTMWLDYFEDPAFETMARVEIENRPEVLRDRQLLEDLRKNLAFWRTLVTQLVTEAKEAGQVRADVDPASLASLFICAYEGLRQFRLVDPDNFQPRQLFEALFTLVPEDAPTEGGQSRQVSAMQEPPPPQRRRGKKKEAKRVSRQ
jgi:AcrR family transcriptional regulator